MTFDLRISIGLLLLACGLVLVGHGVSVGTLVLGININLWWGLIVAGFGALIAWLGWR